MLTSGELERPQPRGVHLIHNSTFFGGLQIEYVLGMICSIAASSSENKGDGLTFIASPGARNKSEAGIS